MQLKSQAEPPNVATIEQLYQKHAHGILLYIHRYVSSTSDADDILLEVFTAALEHQTLHLRSDGEQLAWLRRVAYNKSVDYHRYHSPHRLIGLDHISDIFADDHQTPEAVALRNEEATTLKAHISTLPDQQQEILRLRFAHNLHTKEIAQLLNKSDGAIRKMLSRSLTFLRNIYQQKEDA